MPDVNVSCNWHRFGRICSLLWLAIGALDVYIVPKISCNLINLQIPACQYTPPPPKPIQASSKILFLLNVLYSKSQSQERTSSMYPFWVTTLYTGFFSISSWTKSDDDYMRDEFIAL
ncbi:hypothetical protein BJX68DRAFT_184883 [Aspergillus pseudodeflectus]|uniref:Uncharacterized protein n=1 Tax=Aspergillus pseudodeflectus TaxID=176178 RepID=A0ABR4JL40_9EURO